MFDFGRINLGSLPESVVMFVSAGLLIGTAAVVGQPALAWFSLAGCGCYLVGKSMPTRRDFDEPRVFLGLYPAAMWTVYCTFRMVGTL